MKTTRLAVVGLATSVMLCAVSGCKKEDANSNPQPPPSASQNAPSAAAAVSSAVDTAKATTQQATDQAAAAAKATTDKAQGMIDQAKSLVSSGKYQDAMNSLNQLANVQLTSDQQKTVDDLKQQIQSALSKAATGNAASALGNTLGGNK